METYKLIFRAKGIDLPSDTQTIASLEVQQQIKANLVDYGQKLPRVNSHVRVGLRYLHGDDFAEFLAKYVRPLLIKGVPSTIQDLKEFYKQPAKVAAIEK